MSKKETFRSDLARIRRASGLFGPLLPFVLGSFIGVLLSSLVIQVVCERGIFSTYSECKAP